MLSAIKSFIVNSAIFQVLFCRPNSEELESFIIKFVDKNPGVTADKVYEAVENHFNDFCTTLSDTFATLNDLRENGFLYSKRFYNSDGGYSKTKFFTYPEL